MSKKVNNQTRPPASMLNRSLVQQASFSKPRVGVQQLVNMAIDAESVLEQIREMMLEPYPRKTPPEFSAFQVALNVGMTRTELKSAESEIKSLRGTIKPEAIHKTYSLQEAIELYQLLGGYKPKPEGKRAKIVVVASYKGGVGKTTTAVSIAQGLTLLGRKVLFMDLDGQGSGTMLMGMSPEVEVALEQTIMPFIYQDKPDLSYAPLKTYWHNLDLIPASSALLSAEFVIPGNARRGSQLDAKKLISLGWLSPDQIAEMGDIVQNYLDRGLRADVEAILLEKQFLSQEQVDEAKDLTKYNYWDQLRLGIEPLRDEYDVIVVDTSPSLGYLTQNALTAADMIFSPCPQEALDYASLVQFWGVFAELASELDEFAKSKLYDSVNIFITRAKSENNELATLISRWIKSSFGPYMCDVVIPESTIPERASADLKTVYEFSGKDLSTTAYKRYREPMDQLVKYIHHQLIISWGR